MRRLVLLMIFIDLLITLKAQTMNTHRLIIWKSNYVNTVEFLFFRTGNLNTAEGSIIGESKGAPLHVLYDLEMDSNWNVQSVKIDLNSEKIFFRKDGKNRWYDNNERRFPEFDGCSDVDISLTPFTNSLPINRLKLALGVSKEISVLYFNLLEKETRLMKQRYTNLGNNRFRYENLTSGYSAILEVDEDGFVINYPGIWELVFPCKTQQVGSLTNPAENNFESALLANGPSPELGDSASLYTGLIGSWDVEVIDYIGDGSVHREKGEWHFAWILGGRAVQDVWIAPLRSQRKSGMTREFNRYGTTLRIYDPGLKAWRVYWNNPVSGTHNELIGNRKGNEQVYEGKDINGNLIRWGFKDIQANSFHWYGECSADGGKTWKLEAEFFAKRKLQ